MTRNRTSQTCYYTSLRYAPIRLFRRVPFLPIAMHCSILSHPFIDPFIIYTRALCDFARILFSFISLHSIVSCMNSSIDLAACILSNSYLAFIAILSSFSSNLTTFLHFSISFSLFSLYLPMIQALLTYLSLYIDI